MSWAAFISVSLTQAPSASPAPRLPPSLFTWRQIEKKITCSSQSCFFFFCFVLDFFLPSLSLSLLQFSISMCFQVGESHSQWSNRFEVCMPQEPRSHPLRVNSELFKFPQTKLIQRLFFLLSHQLDPVSAWMKVWFGIFWTRNFAPLQVVYQLQQLGSSSSLGGYLID